jgi:hypothetical protein
MRNCARACGLYEEGGRMSAKFVPKLYNPETPPEFGDWRRTNDAVMIADPAFVRQLRILDPRAYVQWDWGSQRWEIWRKPEGKEPFMLLRVQTADKSYRELGADILLKLQESDPQRFTLQQLVDYFNAIDDRLLEQKQKDMERKFDAIARERQWYMRGLRLAVPQSWERVAVKLEGPKEPRIPLIKKTPTQVIGRVVGNG